MTNALLIAMQTGDALTENGMVTHSVTGSAVLDLFFKQGAARAMPKAELLRMLAQAYAENTALTLRCLFYNRDVRGGQGERETFRTMFNWLCLNAPWAAKANLPNVPFFGRFDDLFVAIGTAVEHDALGFYAAALRAKDGLAGKWAPREGKSEHNLASALRSQLGLSWQDYRKLIVAASHTVEQQMCAQQWFAIDYSKLPSQAALRYRSAFYKRDEARYAAYIALLVAGVPEVKINAAAVFPHQISRKILSSSEPLTSLLQAQWNALPNYVAEGSSLLPICDVSSSMDGEPMDVSMGLGVYLAERNKGPFKDAFITFSAKPELFTLSGLTLKQKLEHLAGTEWPSNTNLEAVFQIILGAAIKGNVPQAELPGTVIIFSDMQFDQCMSHPHDSAMDMIDRQYAEAGYRRPQVVFWNLRSSNGVPSKADKKGVSLLSGFSPSAMKSLLLKVDVPEPTPLETMLEVLNNTRYDRVVV